MMPPPAAGPDSKSGGDRQAEAEDRRRAAPRAGSEARADAAGAEGASGTRAHADAVIVPDYVEPIDAWRVWLVDYELRLRSVLFDAVWPQEEPLVATCRHRRRSWRPWWREVKVDHGAPADDCGCGIYGADREKATHSYGRLALPGWAVGRVVGRVALWGDVVECERGWRASHAYPSRLCAPVVVPFRRRRREAPPPRRSVGRWSVGGGGGGGRSSHDAVDLEDLGKGAVDVDPVRPRHVAHVLLVRVAAMLLRGVLPQRGDLAVDVALLERDVRLVREVEVVPRDLVAEDRRALEGAQALGGDRLVVLVDVVEGRLEDRVRLPLVPDLDQQLEDLLPVLGEGADVEVVDGETRLGDPELGRRLAHLPGERVRREALGQRAGRDREGDVAHVGAGVSEARHRAAAAELTVVGVRREHEHALPVREHRRSIAARARAFRATL